MSSRRTQSQRDRRRREGQFRTAYYERHGASMISRYMASREIEMNREFTQAKPREWAYKITGLLHQRGPMTRAELITHFGVRLSQNPGRSDHAVVGSFAAALRLGDEFGFRRIRPGVYAAIDQPPQLTEEVVPAVAPRPQHQEP